MKIRARHNCVWLARAKKCLFTDGYIFLMAVLSLYSYVVLHRYYVLPANADSIWYVRLVACPHVGYKVFFRYFHYYCARLFTLPFDIPLDACAYYSLACFCVTIAVSFQIVLKLAGRTAAIVAAMLIACCPIFLAEAMVFGPDLPCLMFGLIAFKLSMVYTHSSRAQEVGRVVMTGLFLVAAVFSKTTGIVFTLPVLLNLAYHSLHPRLRRWTLFCVGGMGGLLLLSLGDWLWLGDWLFHLRPLTYAKFFRGFGGSLGYWVNKGGLDWKDTAFELLTRPTYIQYIVFGVFFLGSIRNGAQMQQRLEYTMNMLLVGIVSLALHECVHVRDTLLKIHPRWLYTMVVPVIIAFCSTFRDDTEIQIRNGSRRTILNDVLLMGVFAVLLWSSGQESDFFTDLKSRWNCYDSIIHVLSFWILLMGLGLFALSSGFRYANWRYFGRPCVFTVRMIGLVIVLWYCTTWGGIEAWRIHQKEYTIWREYEEFGAFFNSLSTKTLLVDIGNGEKEVCRFQYLFLRGANIDKAVIDRWAFNEPEPLIGSVIQGNRHYDHVLTQQKDLSATGLALGVKIDKVAEYRDLGYWEIVGPID